MLHCLVVGDGDLYVVNECDTLLWFGGSIFCQFRFLHHRVPHNNRETKILIACLLTSVGLLTFSCYMMRAHIWTVLSFNGKMMEGVCVQVGLLNFNRRCADIAYTDNAPTNVLINLRPPTMSQFLRSLLIETFCNNQSPRYHIGPFHFHFSSSFLKFELKWRIGSRQTK